MSKIAVISDIHGNIHGYDLFLQDASKRGVTKIICLGDLVSKYFYHKEVVDEVRKSDAIVVKGNIEHFLEKAPDSFKAVIENLGMERLDYLVDLPYQKQVVISGALFDFFHATPERMDNSFIEQIFNPFIPAEFQNPRYKDLGLIVDNVSHMFVNEKNVKKLPQNRISFCGHIHKEYAAEVSDNQLTIVDTPEFIINPYVNTLVNVGSIGEPLNIIMNDNKPQFNINNYISYVILEGNLDSEITSDIKVEIIKVPYVDTIKKMYVDMHRIGQGDSYTSKRFASTLTNLGEEPDSLLKR